MRNSFTWGAVAGLSSVALAIPLLSQISSAAPATDATSSAEPKADRPAPSQACVQALAARDGTFLSTIDTMITAQKAATQAHKDALTAAASITDDAARKTAVEKANEAFRTAMKTAMDAQKTNGSAEMDALKAACGNAMGGPGFAGGMMGFEHDKMMRGPGKWMRGQHGQQAPTNVQ